MKMKKILYIALVFSLSSCGYFKQKPPQIRLVGLDGKHREVSTRTPNLNSEILNSQGKSNDNMILKDKAIATSAMSEKGLPKKEGKVNPDVSAVIEVKPAMEEVEVATTKPVAAHNKPVELLKDQERDPDAILFAAPKESGEYDISDAKEEKPVEHVKKSAKNNQRIKKPVFISKNKSRAVEVAATEESTSDVGSGYFVQVGSFSNKAHAQDKLNKMAGFHSGKIEDAGGDKPMYRALLGPVADKNSARNLFKKIKAAGYDAVLIKR